MNPPRLIGTAHLLRLAYAGQDLLPLHLELLQQLRTSPQDAATLMNLCALEQLLGDQASGLRRQAQALALQPLYRSSWPCGENPLRVLAFMARGDIGTNTPIEFLLQGSDSILYSLYCRAGEPLPQTLPPHDIAIVTMGESDDTVPILRQLAHDTASWPVPVLNAADRVPDLSRDNLHRVLHGIPGVVIPPTLRIGRQALARGDLPAACAAFPLIVRPNGSHAGRGLEKLADAASIVSYLDQQPDDGFTLSPYVDYAGADGLFRKYRIVWVDGVPFPCHMAICAGWKVWYLNADMAANAANRAEEAAFMTGFAAFAHRHASALAGIAARLGLDYVGIDCAETPDGKLLVFEGDISLIVHDLDPPAIFPYKGPCMAALFAAFQAMLKRRAGAIAERAA